jgi:hypothetical protein
MKTGDKTAHKMILAKRSKFKATQTAVCSRFYLMLEMVQVLNNISVANRGPNYCSHKHH